MWMVASWKKNKKSWNLILEAGREAQREEGSCREVDQEAHDVVLTNFERGGWNLACLGEDWIKLLLGLLCFLSLTRSLMSP